jgi:hypothetical protein
MNDDRRSKNQLFVFNRQSKIVIRQSAITALVSTFSTRHLFRALSGRVSTMRTRSPGLQIPFSSCARNLEVFRILFL